MNADTVVGEDEETKKINAEWRFLARRVLLLCAGIERLGKEATPTVPDARETCLQQEAFLERRQRAMALIEMIRAGQDRPTRHLEDLRRLVAGLECSRSFFGSGQLMA